MDDNNMIIFNRISSFVNELAKEFQSTYKPLKLYKHLINKTNISHKKAIKKHISVFTEYCVKNREALLEKDVSKLNSSLLKYSSRIYIDVKAILEQSDDELTKEAIWAHLLYISAYVDPAGKAKDVLRKNLKEGKTGQDETEFLTNIISKVEKNVEPNSDPSAAFSSIMNSNLLGDLMNGMQSGLSSGKLDMSKLLGGVQGMLSSLQTEVGDDPQAAGMMNMMNMLMGSMGNMGNMGNMTTMNLPKVEEIPENKKSEEEK